MDTLWSVTEVFAFVVRKMGRFLLDARLYVNKQCNHLEPWELIFYTVSTMLTLVYLKQLLHQEWPFRFGLKHIVFEWLPHVPVLKKYAIAAKKKLEDATRQVEAQVNEGLEKEVLLQELPKNGWSSSAVLNELKTYLDQGKYKWDEGYVSGAVYHGHNEELKDLVTSVFKMTAYHNPLHPDVFPGVRLLEAEIIRIVCSLYGGDQDSCGTVTTGGTEGIFLACKAYRDYAYHRKGITQPVMIIPITAHAAFDKAAHVLRIKVKHIPMDPATTKVDVKAMRKAINKNTCMLVGSAPAFPHGSIDPIEEIAKLGCKHDIPVHVDACLGGFLVPFMRRAGYNIPLCDFSVKGVTSISADTHKYAYAPKGSSVVLYKNKTYRHYQYFVQPDWPGGIYGTPGLSGSRSGGIIASCWATLVYHGEDFYLGATRKIISVAKYIEAGINEIPELFVLGKPDVSVIAIGSSHFDIYRLSGALTERGWNVNLLQYPSSFHFCVTLQHTKEVAENFLMDVRQCTEEIMKCPNERATGSAAIYGMAQRIPDRSIVSELVWTYLDACTSSKMKA